ncbi:4Fe-4S binding protein, partial [Anaerobutyricum hallii]
VVEETLCVGCGKCARSCPVGCIEMKERVAV